AVRARYAHHDGGAGDRRVCCVAYDAVNGAWAAQEFEGLLLRLVGPDLDACESILIAAGRHADYITAGMETVRDIAAFRIGNDARHEDAAASPVQLDRTQRSEYG